jgi:hypothetical protein
VALRHVVLGCVCVCVLNMKYAELFGSGIYLLNWNYWLH